LTGILAGLLPLPTFLLSDGVLEPERLGARGLGEHHGREQERTARIILWREESVLFLTSKRP
jgi:hypothetical protein